MSSKYKTLKNKESFLRGKKEERHTHTHHTRTHAHKFFSATLNNMEKSATQIPKPGIVLQSALSKAELVQVWPEPLFQEEKKQRIKAPYPSHWGYKYCRK